MTVDPEIRLFAAEISDTSLKAIFDKLIDILALLKLKTALQRGVFNAVRIYDASGRYYFATIVNKKHLLFYIRKPFLKDHPDLFRDALEKIDVANPNPAGEITVRIESIDDLNKIAKWLAHHLSITVQAANRVQSAYGVSVSDEMKGIGMESLVVPASRVRQGSLTLYTTSVKVADLIRPGFYSVETLDPDSDDDKGFQRLLNKARAKKLADYILRGQDDQDAFLPTSVFLATDKEIQFDEMDNKLSIDLKNGAFSVVDGQHRLEGLKMAAEKDERVLDFEVPVNIAANLPKIAQMCHFLIVNTTQKSVDKSVEQRIMARLTEALDIEDIPNLPSGYAIRLNGERWSVPFDTSIF
ncbi:MAG: DGQHR domain-containing protein [Sphingomonadaceae bacterium]